MQDVVVITGLSGAGRSLAADALEDLGWFVIDNLPPAMIPSLLETGTGHPVEHVGLVLGPGRYHDELLPAIKMLRDSDAAVTVVFLEARERVLVQRYESTRRKHPFDPSSASLSAAISAERAALEPVKAESDLVIDTSDFNVHGLRNRMIDYFADGSPGGGMRTRILSFGFKHGLPLDVDLVIDCRFLPNPYWDDELRPLTGRDQPVKDFLHEHEVTGAFLDQLRSMLELLMPAYVKEGKSYLTIAFGCTGGRHRSVVIAEAVADQLRELGIEPTVAHRDTAF